MLSLAINTATSTSSFALFDNNLKLLAEKNWPAKNNEAEKILPEISKSLKKLKKNFTDISRVICVRGPGSFTGLRVGVTVANTIAHLNHAKLFAVDTFEYLWHATAERSEAAIPPSPALLLYAGRGGVYVSFNHEDASRAELVSLPDLNSFLKKNKVKSVFGDISEDQFLHVQEFVPVQKPTPRTFSATMQNFLQNLKLKPFTLVDPIYIKKPY